jgi:hypothetical protein
MTFRKLVSVAGLSPARLCLKNRVLEMLCIDGVGKVISEPVISGQ